MEKIFILIPWFHPAYKAGGPIQSIAALVNTMQTGFQFKIFCSNKDLNNEILPSVITDKWVSYNANTSVYYSSSYSIINVLRKEINAEKPLAIFISGIYDWQFNFLPLLKIKGIKKIISARGMLHPEALQQKWLKKNLYLLYWKFLGLHHSVIFHATDTREAAFIKKSFGQKANVIEAANFPNFYTQQPMPRKNAEQLKLFTIALISPMKNILNVLEALQQCRYTIEYTIAGPVKDITYWQQCLKIIATLPQNISVKYVGAVSPGDTKNILQQNHICILPSKSENYGHSIIEALSAGRPVITSHNTPWNSLQQARAGINVDGENINETAAAIDFFAAMPQQDLAIWSLSANEYAAGAINVQKTTDQYKLLFGAAMPVP